MDSIRLSSPGLSPSNRIAGFPNLARQTPCGQETIDLLSATCRGELEAAGIKVFEFSWLLSEKSEVPSRVRGGLSMWWFERAWYYWRAKGPGIPPDIAEHLHASHGNSVRVAGHCGCPSPLEWYKGFAVGDYHIDSPEGLKAFADTLLSIYDASKDPTATPRTQ